MCITLIFRNMYEPQDSNHLLNKHNTDGVTPLCVAAQNGNYEVVKFLIEKGADHLRETKVIFRNILFI